MSSRSAWRAGERGSDLEALGWASSLGMVWRGSKFSPASEASSGKWRFDEPSGGIVGVVVLDAILV